ncbi:MAG: hypothetical protein ABI347_06365 [Nitrososphaera sp.]|jgi:hypothetical protein
MKRWHCVQVDHHERIGGTVEEFGKQGWRLHTYTTAGPSSTFMGYTVNHYLLFEKDE